MEGSGLQEQLDALARRIDVLERRIRIQRLAAAVAFVAAAGGIALAQGDNAGAAAAEVRASRIALVGREGRTLAALEPAAGGGARLAFFGAGDATPMTLQVGADGAPSLRLADGAGFERIGLRVAGDEARVSVRGRGKTEVTLANDGIAPRVAISDAQGADRVWLAVRLGSPVMQFLDPRGIARTGLTTFNDDSGLAVISDTDRSRPGLVLLGKDRSVVWSAP
jgi:hypothetical protein